jgi:hypothetical protein
VRTYGLRREQSSYRAGCSFVFTCGQTEPAASGGHSLCSLSSSHRSSSTRVTCLQRTQGATTQLRSAHLLGNHGAGSGPDWTVHSGKELGNRCIWQGRNDLMPPFSQRVSDPSSVDIKTEDPSSGRHQYEFCVGLHPIF